MPNFDHSKKRRLAARGFCAECGKVKGVGVDGTFHRHCSSSGTVCAGSGNPLHAPGQHGRTVATYALLRDEVHNGIVMVHMSPGRHRLRLLLIGGVGGADIVQLSLAPGRVRQIADDLGAWVRAARQVVDPLEATALATGTVAVAPDITWKRALPPVRTVLAAGGGLVKARSGSGAAPELCPVVRVEVDSGCRDYLSGLVTVLDACPGPAVGEARRQEVWTATE